MLICHNLYGEVSFQVLYPSFHAVEFHIFQNIYICGYKSCIRYVICRYFLSIVTWSFLFLSMSSAEQKCFNLIKSNLSIFSCISSVQFSRSVMSDSVTPWIAARQASVHHQLLEFTQTHIHRVGDAIQPSHPLSYPSSPAPNPSQDQSLFQWVNSSHEVAKVLEFQLQHHSLQRNPRLDLVQNGLVGSPCSPRDSQESSPTPQFKSINSSVLSFLHSPTLTCIHYHRKNHSLG